MAGVFQIPAYLVGSQNRPSQITFYDMTGGAERWLKIPFDLSQPPVTYAVQAHEFVKKTPFVPYHGRTTGFIVNYTPDSAVRFDLDGDPVERLQHIDLAAGKVRQDAREVRTKFSKTFPTFLLPVGDDIRAIFEDWVNHLQSRLLWGPDDPLFPKTRIALGASGQFEASGLEREGWRNSGPIRAIFRKAFEGAGLPYFNPHSFRHAVARYGQTICSTIEEFQAISQNLGHSSVKTTLMHYGEVPAERQRELIRNLGKAPASDDRALSLARALIELLEGSRRDEVSSKGRE